MHRWYQIHGRCKKNVNNVYFIDPPYWVAGTRLYDYSDLDHRQLFNVVQTLKGDFLMT